MIAAPASAAAALAGGSLIGLGAAIMLIGAGRIAGISGLAARAAGLAEGGGARAIAAAFVVGLPLGAGGVALALGGVATHYPATPWPAAIGGLLVGYGTRLGSGCTSGHGVCGVARLSPRSIAATLVFMASGIATVALLRAAGAA